MRHLLATDDLDRQAILRLLELSDHMSEVTRRPQPKVPALRGRTVCMAFFEDSTRTRLSFDLAAKRLSADTMTFSASGSSLSKGEGLRDTIETLSAMGVDCFIVRHRSSGVPGQMTRWTDAAVINAGDGWHAHPTQALLDCFTVRRRLDRPEGFEGLRVAMVGDIRHSRVARSTLDAFGRLGAELIVVAPTTLLPPDASVLSATVTTDFDSVIGDVDIVYLLRMQNERIAESLVPSVREYSARFGLTPERADRLRPDALVMHPGPMNRGVEILVDPDDLPGSVICDQVDNGIAVRMAVLFDLLGSGRIEEEST